MANRFVSPQQQFINNAGQPYAGGFLYFYISGTSTPTPTYQDEELTTPNSNPVVLDSAGDAGNIFLDPTIVYKVVLTDSSNNPIWTFDPVIPTDAPSSTAVNAVISCTPSGGPNAITLTPISASQQPSSYSNYTIFAFVPSVTTTNLVTVQVGTLAFYPVYLTSGVQAGSGAFVANTGPYFLAYGSIVAGASPGFLLLNPNETFIQPFFNAKTYGAAGDGSTDDTTALNNWLAAASAVGGVAFLPPGSYKITSSLNVSAHVRIMGCGYQTSPISYGYGSTVANIDARSSGFNASVIIQSNSADSAITVTTTDSVSIESLHITYPNGGSSSVAALNLNTATGNVGCNMGSVVRDVLINNANVGASVQNWLDFVFDNVIFITNTLPMVCENSNSINFTGSHSAGTASDSTIVNCTFFNTQGANHLQLFSGGGYRIQNNKFNITNAISSLNAAILIAPQVLPNLYGDSQYSMEPLLIIGNSIEGSLNGILAQPTANAQIGASQWIFANNQIWVGSLSGGTLGGQGISTVAGSGTTPATWLSGLSITGNYINIGDGYTGGTAIYCCSIDGAEEVLISGNVFVGNTTNNLSVYQGAQPASGRHFKISGNQYPASGSTIPSPTNVAPSVPATNTLITNTSGFSVLVSIQGGTVSSMIVKPFGQVSGVTVATTTNTSAVIGPDDQIELGYSAAPTWVWMPLSP